MAPSRPSPLALRAKLCAPRPAPHLRQQPAAQPALVLDLLDEGLEAIDPIVVAFVQGIRRRGWGVCVGGGHHMRQSPLRWLRQEATKKRTPMREPALPHAAAGLPGRVRQWRAPLGVRIDRMRARRVTAGCCGFLQAPTHREWRSSRGRGTARAPPRSRAGCCGGSGRAGRESRWPPAARGQWVAGRRLVRAHAPLESWQGDAVAAGWQLVSPGPVGSSGPELWHPAAGTLGDSR
jgi:hypothetical protein